MENAATYDELLNENAALKAEVSALKSVNAEIDAKLSWLIEQLSSTNRKLYGQSSERSIYDQIGLFGNKPADVFVIDPAAQFCSPEPPKKERPKKQGEMGTRLPEGLPVETVEVELPEDQRECPDGHGLGA